MTFFTLLSTEMAKNWIFFFLLFNGCFRRKSASASDQHHQGRLHLHSTVHGRRGQRQQSALRDPPCAWCAQELCADTSLAVLGDVRRNRARGFAQHGAAQCLAVQANRQESLGRGALRQRRLARQTRQRRCCLFLPQIRFARATNVSLGCRARAAASPTGGVWSPLIARRAARAR